MCDQIKSDSSTTANDMGNKIDVCEVKENEKLNCESYRTDDIAAVINSIDTKSMATATNVVALPNNTINTVAVIQQKLELTPKTVESESQTDITVTNDYCKSVVVAPVTAIDTATTTAAICADTVGITTSEAILITTDCDDTMMKSTADIDCNESKNNDVISVNMNVIDATLKKEENNELKSNNKLNDTTKMIISNNDKMNYLEEPEMSLIEIKEKLIEIENNTGKTADSESEEDDQLKPLMTFNHAVIDNQEYYNYNLGHSHHQYVKHIEPKDSYSSTDSDDILQDCRMSSSLYRRDGNLESHHNHDHKDSGCENIQQNVQQIKEIDTLPPSEIPDDQMCANIVEQVEFYFSNESILRDAFLLKHVRRNKEGFVSLKLISSFKRVRQLTKDWRVVGYAIQRKSRKIELNDLGTKIRRLEPLPSFDETMPSRTIVACDLPIEKLCIEKVSDIFSKCGEIALIRILRPGMGIPVDVRQFMNKYPEMQQKECALVEFVESQAARNALNLNGNFKVYEMVAPRKKTGKKATSVTKMIENYKFIDHNYERSRGGGSNSGGGGSVMNMNTSLENNYKYNNTIRRNSADYYPRPDHQQFQHQQQSMQQSTPQHIYSPRKYSFNESNNKSNNNNNNYNNNNNSINNETINYGTYSPRRISSCSMGSSDYSRKYSSCSEGYSSCSELSRRASTCSSDQSRRTSNCSDFCPCSRRSSQCSDIYRRISQCSEHNHVTNNRKFSNGSGIFSNTPTMRRRISMDSNYERKISTGSMGSTGGTGNGNGGGGNNGLIMHEQYRKYDPNHKLSNTDQYYNDRRVSIDSGYDRKLSFGSDYGSSPRSRSNSFLMCHQHKNIENVVRTPIGPDGSKGFTPRTRKLGQIVPPV